MIAEVALDFVQLTATPSPPAAGRVIFYSKSDGKVYRMLSDGVEVLVG